MSMIKRVSGSGHDQCLKPLFLSWAKAPWKLCEWKLPVQCTIIHPNPCTLSHPVMSNELKSFTKFWRKWNTLSNKLLSKFTQPVFWSKTFARVTLTTYKIYGKKIALQKVHDGWENRLQICPSCKICMVGQLGVKRFDEIIVCLIFWLFSKASSIMGRRKQYIPSVFSYVFFS
jgi:hypothetical protein